MYKLLTILLSILIITLISYQCRSLDDSLVEPEYRTADSSILNYEDASMKFTDESISSHFKIRIEIDKPYVIRSVEYEPDKIYGISGISGVTVFKVDLESSGSIVSYKIIKTAGLELDSMAEKIVRGLKLSPVSREGYNYRAAAILRIIFTGKERL